MESTLKKDNSAIRNILVLTFIFSRCSGVTFYLWGCSNYSILESKETYRNWKESRDLCNQSGGDLVSIEEFDEWKFLNTTIQNHHDSVKYFIGLKKEKETWAWLSNGKPVNATTGNFPWAENEPNGNSGGTTDTNCATMYGNYSGNYGLFDDVVCEEQRYVSGYICERNVSGECKNSGSDASHNSTRPASTHTSPVTSVTGMVMNTSRGQGVTEDRKDSISTVTTQASKVPSTTQSAMLTPDRKGLTWTKESEKAKQVRSTTPTSWKGQPSAQSTSEIGLIASATTNLDRAEESSYLITIIVSVLAFVILGIGIALWYLVVYRPRKNVSKSNLQRDHRQNGSTQLRRHGGLSPAEDGMDDLESLPEVQRQDTCVDIEEGDRGSFLSMPQSSTKRQEEAFIKDQSSEDGSNAPLNISATTKTSKKNNTSNFKAFLKKDTPEKHHVYAIVHIHPKQDKAAFHLDPVMPHLGECPSHLTADEEKCKASVVLSSSGLEKELTRNEETSVEQNASGQDQCNNCVYAVVDKTKKKRQPPKKPAPYRDLLYADLSHSPKKSDNGGIHQESIATVYADIDHIKSSAMTDSRLKQENEVKLT